MMRTDMWVPMPAETFWAMVGMLAHAEDEETAVEAMRALDAERYWNRGDVVSNMRFEAITTANNAFIEGMLRRYGVQP